MIRDTDADLSGKASPVVIYVSSDEGSPVVAARRGLSRASPSLPEGDRGLAANNDNDDKDAVMIGKFIPKLKSRNPKVDCNDDDDCLVLDRDPNEPVLVRYLPCDDVLVVAEKGQVASRDYPHARYDCAKFPFSTTPHEKHCDMCHCYVCDSFAPCARWGTGLFGHCNANDKDENWKARRNIYKHAMKMDKSVPALLTTKLNRA
ncbi:hypothetical protein MLD38_020245 [Melastoma candidum]|uniref:Uncharacterized protein n=1 Tax=Melastoma candidum TaxID=119954 RepID=A0ACB9QCQ7_9MYRT|nr:hypothetical protein MLD38_020245 [Melastoma candidum]